MLKTRILALLCAAALLPQAFQAVHAQAVAQAQTYEVNIPAQPLAAALAALSRQTGVQVFASGDLVAGRTSPAVSGRLTVSEALSRLLAGTGLEGRREGSGFAVQLAQAPRSEQQLPEVKVQAASDPAALPAPYAGGQVARGGRVGMLGNRDLFDTPFSQNNYTEQLIRDQQARSLSDVLANDSSVRTYVTPTGEDLFVVRGFGLPPENVSFDGLYGMVDGRRPILENVERVELLRGPTAVLNGVPAYGAVGGTINLVPKRATDAPLARVTGRYLSESNFGGAIDLGRRFGMDNAFGARLNAARSDGKTPVENQKAERNAATLGLDFRGDRLRLTADFVYGDQSIAGPHRLLTVAPGFEIPKAPPADRLIQQPWETFDTEFRSAVGRVEYDLTPQMTAFAAYGRSVSGETFFQGNPRLLNAQGDISQQIGYFEFEVDNETMEAGLRARFSTGTVRHQAAIVASKLYWTGSSSPFNVIGAPILNNIYSPVVLPAASRAGSSLRPLNKESTQDLTGLALADTLSILDERVQLTAGLRFQTVDNANFDTTTGAQTSSYDKSATTPILALLVKPLRWLSLYGSFIEGLSPGPTAPTTGVSNPGEVFPPFVSKQYEVGAKANFGGFGITAAAFQITQPSAFTDPATTRFGVDGEQRNRGVELSAFGEVARGLRVLGGVSLIDAELTRTQAGAFDGNDAAGVPQTQFNLGGEYDLRSLPGVTVSGRVLYTGEQYQDQANTRSIPSWTRLDLGARYVFKLQGRQTAARFNVENVMGKDYWQGAGFGLLSIGGPRTYSFSLSVDL